MEKKGIIGILILAFCSSTSSAQSFVAELSNFGLWATAKGIACVDIDNDGDMDAFSVNGGNGTEYWQNTGTKVSPAFSLGSSHFGLSATATDLAFVDIDNDGDMDAFSVNGGNGTEFWRNTGTNLSPTFTLGSSNFNLFATAEGISFADMDNDGDRDAFTVNGGNGTEYWQNTGTKTSPTFNLGSSNFGLYATAKGISLADIDHDGDLDAFSVNGGNGTEYWQNTGTKASPAFTMGSNFGLFAVGVGITLADMDDDGDTDAFSVDGGNGTTFWRNATLTGFYNLKKSIENSVSPNPFSRYTTFNIDRHVLNANINVYDLSGNNVRKLEQISSTFVFERENLNEGLYFYVITEGDNIISSGKLVIN